MEGLFFAIGFLLGGVVGVLIKIQAVREEVSGKDEKARQEPEQGRAAPPGRR